LHSACLIYTGISCLIKRLVRDATERRCKGLALERNLFLKLCISEPALARMRAYEESTSLAVALMWFKQERES